MFDLQALALQAEITRVITYQLAREVSTRSYPQIGVADAHHPAVAPRQRSREARQAGQDQVYHVSLFAHFLERLKATSEGDATLLDNSLYLLGSGLGNSDRHDHTDLPVVLAGGGSGDDHRAVGISTTAS